MHIHAHEHTFSYIYTYLIVCMLLAAYHCLELYLCISVNGASCHESDIEDLIDDS